MTVTFGGIVKFDKLQPMKQALPSVVTLSSPVMEVRFEHPWNASFSMVVTVVGKITEESTLQPPVVLGFVLNAPSGIEVIEDFERSRVIRFVLSPVYKDISALSMLLNCCVEIEPVI